MRPMHAIIHIGTQKTGSCAIQNFLFSNHDLLLEQDCLYPLSIASPLPGLHDHNTLVHRPLLDIRELLRRELEAQRHARIIISSENLSACMASVGQVGRVRKMLEQLGFGEFRVVVWLRESGAMFASLCSQWLRDGDDQRIDLLPPEDSPRMRFLLDYRGLLQRWAAVFGEEALEVRLFEQECFVRHDLLADACDAFGLSWDERFVLPGRVNESLNLLEMEVLRAVNRLEHGQVYRPDTPQHLLFEHLHRHLGPLDSPELRFAPPQAITAAWREHCAGGNDWVRRRFFRGRPELFAAVQPLEEHDAIPGMKAAWWEALGHVLADLCRENMALRAALHGGAAPQGAASGADGKEDRGGQAGSVPDGSTQAGEKRGAGAGPP